MPESKTRLQYLYEQFVHDNATANEVAEFWALLQKADENDAVSHSVFQEYNNSNSAQESTSVNWAIVLDKIFKTNESEKNVALRLRKQISFYAAAILFLFFVCSGIWFWHNKQATQQLGDNLIGQDKKPGYSGAVLTLANGQQIILDSSGIIPINIQGTTQIVKNGGKICYSPNAQKSSSVAYNTLSTPKAREFEVLLPDGSHVWLNAASSLRYPTAFKGNNRQVELTGEAYFEVAHNATKPFIVKVRDMEVKVLGTHFNINAYSDEPSINTTLLEGSVNISTHSFSQMLKPGWQAKISNSNSNSNISIDKDIDVNEATAWKNEKFIFKDANLQDIMRQISRWYNVEIVYNGDITNEMFNGVIDRKANLSRILKVLELGGVHFKLKENKLFVNP
ncbi:MAG: FecR family protein [Arachidicoccus sp.]|nr:FecR family protein [Arachidicoccus sp.]